MGIRVHAETLKKQLEISGQTDFLKFPYHQGIIKSEIPLSVGRGIGQDANAGNRSKRRRCRLPAFLGICR
jgi:asparagine synthetase A